VGLVALAAMLTCRVLLMPFDAAGGGDVHRHHPAGHLGDLRQRVGVVADGEQGLWWTAAPSAKHALHPIPDPSILAFSNAAQVPDFDTATPHMLGPQATSTDSRQIAGR